MRGRGEGEYWSDDLQPQASAERLAQPFGQNRVVNEDMQAVGVGGEKIGEYDGRKRPCAGQIKPAEDTAQVAVAGAVGDQGHTAPTVLAQVRAQQWANADTVGGFDKCGCSVEIIRIGERETGVTVSGGLVKQGVGAGRAFQERIPAMRM